MGEGLKNTAMYERAEKRLLGARAQKTEERVLEERVLEERVLLGYLRAAHGIHGLVKIESFAEPPENIAKYDKLRCDELGEGFVELRELRRYKNAKGVIAKILGCENRQQAEALRGAKLYIMQKDLPPLAEDYFYHQSLIGLPVLNANGKLLGEVATLQNFGAGELLEVRMKGSAEENGRENNKENVSDREKSSKYSRKEECVFIPFSRDVVSRISESAVEVCGTYAEILAKNLEESLAKNLAKNLVEKQAQGGKKNPAENLVANPASRKKRV